MMEEVVRKDIVKLLKEAVDAIKQGDINGLASISNHTIHNASIYQDEYSVSIAVIIFALSKLGSQGEHIDEGIVFRLQEARQLLKQKRIDEYFKTIQGITESVRSCDSQMRKHIQETLDRAQIKKGTKIFSQGISLPRAAELLGLSQWELMQYVGKTSIPEDEYISPDIKEKITFVRKMFQIKREER